MFMKYKRFGKQFNVNIELQNTKFSIKRTSRSSRRKKKNGEFYLVSFSLFIEIVKRASTVPRFSLKQTPNAFVCTDRERLIYSHRIQLCEVFAVQSLFSASGLAGNNNYCFQEMVTLHESKHFRRTDTLFYFQSKFSDVCHTSDAHCSRFLLNLAK